MTNYPYKQVGTQFDRVRNDINENLVAIENDFKEVKADYDTKINEVKSANEDTQAQVDNLIIESGTSDAETIQARGSYDLLYKRLDDSDAQLAHVTNQSNFLVKIKSNKTIELTEDINLESRIVLQDISNLTIKSLNGKTKISTELDQVFYLYNCSNITFENIIFESKQVSENPYGTVYIRDVGRDITFRNCNFTTKGVNGVKIIAEAPDLYVKNIYFDNCVFDTIGRMGLETQNHSGLGYATIEGVYVTNCRFYNVGTVRYPMMTSFSGTCKNVNVKGCDFDGTANPNTIGIEGIWMSESTIESNYFKGAFKWTSFSNANTMYNNKIINNTTHDAYMGEFYLANQKELIFSNNAIKKGRVYLLTSEDCIITNNFINADYQHYCIFLDNSQKNTVSNNNFISLISNWSVVRAYGVGAKYNTVINNRYIYSGGNFFAQTDGALDNFYGYNFSGTTGIIATPEYDYIKRKTKTFASNSVTFTVDLRTNSGWSNMSIDIDIFLYMGSGTQSGARQRVKGVANVNYYSSGGLGVLFSSDQTLGLDITTASSTNTSFTITVTDTSGNNYVNCLLKIEDISGGNGIVSLI